MSPSSRPGFEGPSSVLFEPLRKLLRDYLVRRVVAALASHPAVVCILRADGLCKRPCSFFPPRSHLFVLFREDIARNDPAAAEIVHRYRRVRPIWGLIEKWPEPEPTLVFLSDIAAGFPLPESLSLCLKLGAIALLHGKLPFLAPTEPVTTSELLCEMNSLLRQSLMAPGRDARRLAFWNGIFSSLKTLAQLLGQEDCWKEFQSRPELEVLAQNGDRSFFRTADPNSLFCVQLALTGRILEAVGSREPNVRISSCAGSVRPTGTAVVTPFATFSKAPNQQRFTAKPIPSIPIGITPSFLSIPLDEPLPLVQLHDDAYDGLRRLCEAKPSRPGNTESALIRAEGFLFLATYQADGVDLTPLDTLQFANVYAAAFSNSLDFETPEDVLAEQRAKAASMFRGLAHLYRANDGVVRKLSCPCIYREHDAEVIDNALNILRSRIAFEPRGTFLQSAADLFDYLRRRHPECAHFLSELERYRNSLSEDSPAGQESFNNGYHCLHQFMWQFLEGAEAIVVDSPSRHLGITVGVITRNRAGDLAEMLESLTQQSRPPDEVLIVDNGSTDGTPGVVAGFSGRLPIRRCFLDTPDIPGARNLVIERAAHEIVSFIDDDCISEPEWLAAVEAGFLRAENVGIVDGWVTHERAARSSTVENYYRVFHHLKS